jgi:hypothetical protein
MQVSDQFVSPRKRLIAKDLAHVPVQVNYQSMSNEIRTVRAQSSLATGRKAAGHSSFGRCEHPATALKLGLPGA